MSEVKPEDLAANYLAVKKERDKLDAALDTMREQLTTALAANTVTQPTTWEVGAAKVTWVRGREKVSLDRGKLVRLGVTADILNKATTKTVGRPSIRIESKMVVEETAEVV